LKIKALIKPYLFGFLGLVNLLKFYWFQYHKIKNSDIVFFFPYYHTGGAERVHLNIVQALRAKKCCVIFTHASATTNFLEAFKDVSTTIELNAILNKKNSFVTRKLSQYIVRAINNKKKIKKVFGCNTNYYYELLPSIDLKIKTYDLIHALAKNDSREAMLAHSSNNIYKRIVINQKAKDDLAKIYAVHGLGTNLLNAIQIISNGIVIPDFITKKDYKSIKIGFIGRWSQEKRPQLYLKIAKSITTTYPNIHFCMAGTGMNSNKEVIADAKVEYLGELTTSKDLMELYKELNMLIICSVYEGFPMVMMESMPHKVVPVCTNVGGISEHITSNENGILIEDMNEIDLEEAFISQITKLVENENNLIRLSENASKYAKTTFDIVHFNKAYLKLLN